MTMIIAKWTVEEYHRMIEAGILSDRQVELLTGEIIEMSPEGEPHAYCSHEAANYLSSLLGDLATIRQAKPITLPNDSEPEPDIAIVQRLGREYREHHPYPENIFWVIEYANSSLDKDLEIKSKIYAQAGILEYWVVNLQKLHLIIFRDILDGEYATKQTFLTGTIQPLAFPNVTVAVENIINK
ncbi:MULTISPECIES: Uma2 family endonuclease [unclassified Anabaena]|uniref:Uma2 family endonuclease n=1 Tax=unclassified Anabaena TaxID=2619674 RepID=UPI00083796F3|nr:MULTISPECIES: Uma2 family endonuclease [unclassified Anabaena]